jgi:hypothetical protein
MAVVAVVVVVAAAAVANVVAAAAAVAMAGAALEVEAAATAAAAAMLLLLRQRARCRRAPVVQLLRASSALVEVAAQVLPHGVAHQARQQRGVQLTVFQQLPRSVCNGGVAHFVRCEAHTAGRIRPNPLCVRDVARRWCGAELLLLLWMWWWWWRWWR